MAPSKENNQKEKPSSSFLSSSSKFYPAISTMAVARICLTSGFAAAESSALRSLSDIAGLYLQTLARSAASAANVRGRTQSNLLDVIGAMEEASIHRGFPGASKPARPLIESSVVRDSMAFVESMEEVPFPKPIRLLRDEAAERSGVRVPAEEGTWNHVPAHVPRWLPGFPEWRREERKKVREKERLRWEELIGLGSDGEPEEEIGTRVMKDLPAERERVRFKLGLLGKRRKMGFLLKNEADGDEEKGGNKKKRVDKSFQSRKTKNNQKKKMLVFG